jgi:hypothetical protein
MEGLLVANLQVLDIILSMYHDIKCQVHPGACSHLQHTYPGILPSFHPHLTAA